MLEVITVFLVAVTMALPLAHALEWPGKRRLDPDTYRAVQTIYYPGFTIGGFSEVVGIAAATALLWTTPLAAPEFAGILTALVSLVAMHIVYWVVTHPVNKFWLEDVDLERLGSRFFGVDGSHKKRRLDAGDRELWTRLRDRWEYSHAVRAVLAVIALLGLLLGISK